MRLSARSTVQFGLLVGFAAIFVDAIVAHGLYWENDPYWTYWVTKTFLITTIFTLGTALAGVGIWQGAAITLVHTLVLEVYYQWFAPVGLPQEPEWLDTNHVWISGTPAHFLAIFAGYLFALWVFRRNGDPWPADDARRVAWPALGTRACAVVLEGIVTWGLFMHRFPGVTYFIQYLLIGVGVI